MITLTDIALLPFKIIFGTLDAIGPATGDIGVVPDIPTEPYPEAPADEETSWAKAGFLGLATAVGVTVTCAPALYAAYKGRKRGKKARPNILDDPMFLALEGASNRATSLMAGVAPAFAMPIAYIGVQELEGHGIISKGLGNSVQGLMTAGVVAPAIGNVIGSVISRGAKGKV